MAKISLPVAKSDDTTSSVPNPETIPKTRAQGGTVMTEIAYEVSHNAVIVYMKGTPEMPQCGFSAKTAAILGSFGVKFHSVNILADPEKRQAIKEFSDWPTIPQVYVGGEFLGGSDIITQMYQNGELEELIQSHR